MKLATITVKDFRRFSDLTIRNIPESTRLIMLAGPNGCGKSSLFDALAVWHRSTALPQVKLEWDSSYHSKIGTEFRRASGVQKQIQIAFHEDLPQDENELKKIFYIRSAYRNDPEFQINQLNRSGPVLDEAQTKRMINNDAAVSNNYRRMASDAFQDIFESAEAQKTIGQFREEVIAEVRNPFKALFPEMELNSLSNPLVDGTFRFTKGNSKGFEFKNLSGGEKAAFDLILDIVVHRREYDNTVFCIDEPESHMNARLQANLLQVLYDLIPKNCQLVMATHSIGMMRRARDIEATAPQSVAFLNFADRNFDDAQVIEPTATNRNFWHGVYEVALDDLAALVAPKQVIICEGEPKTKASSRNHNHDAQCYNAIFGNEFPDTYFISMGSDQQILDDKRGLVEAIPLFISGITVTKLIDRDDRTNNEVNTLQQNGVRVLSKRNLESYLYDDEIITALAISEEQPDKIQELLQAKRDACATATGPADNLKPVAGAIYNDCKRILGLTQRGNTASEFARETLAPLVKPSMTVYSSLKQDIFGA